MIETCSYVDPRQSFPTQVLAVRRRRAPVEWRFRPLAQAGVERAAVDAHLLLLADRVLRARGFEPGPA